MIVKKTADVMMLSFEQRDWNCGRADAVIEHLKRDISKEVRTFDVKSKTWIITRRVDIEETFDEIIRLHTWNQNQPGLFDQAEAA